MPRSDSAITASAFGKPFGAQLGALERVDGDVDLRRRAVADLLAVVEHRRLVLLALADHHDAVHRHGVEHQPHGVDGGAVGRLLLARARPSARRPARAYSVTRTSSMREVAVGRASVALGRVERAAIADAQMTPGGLRALGVAAPGGGSRRRACPSDASSADEVADLEPDLDACRRACRG